MQTNKKNAGLETSQSLSVELGIPYAVPNSQAAGITDFNDIHKAKGIDEVAASFNNLEIHNDWLEPVPLESKPKYGEPLLTDFLPDLIKDFVEQSSARLQVAPELVAMPLLSVFASAIGRSVAIKPKKLDSWIVVPKLWCLTVADPGQKKSPAFSCALQMLDKIECEIDAINKSRMQEWDAKRKTEEEKIKALRKKASKVISEKPKELHGPMPEIDFAEAEALEKQLYSTKPRVIRIRTSDATGEKLLSMLSDNPNGLLVFRDEIAGLFSDLEKSHRASERQLILESFNGDLPYKQDRMSRENTSVSGVRLTIVGGIQPDVLKKFILRQDLDSDGLLQRFQLLIAPAPIKPKKSDVFVPNELSDKIFAKVRKLFNATQVIQELGDLKEFRTTVSFDSEAQDIFSDWLMELENDLQSENIDNILKTHLSKYRSLIPELCLVFHIMDSDLREDFKFSDIKKDTLMKVIFFSEFLKKHMCVVYGFKDSQLDLAQLLIKKIASHQLKNNMTVRELQRKGWSGCTDSKQLWFALNTLIENHFIRVDTIRSPKGGASKQVIKINPKLLPTKLTHGSTFTIQEYANDSTSEK